MNNYHTILLNISLSKKLFYFFNRIINTSNAYKHVWQIFSSNLGLVNMHYNYDYYNSYICCFSTKKKKPGDTFIYVYTKIFA